MIDGVSHGNGLRANDGIDPDDVIMSPDQEQSSEDLTSTVVFPVGNVAPQGSVIKATAIDPSVVDADGVYRHRGPARVFTSERDAIRAVKGLAEHVFARRAMYWCWLASDRWAPAWKRPIN